MSLKTLRELFVLVIMLGLIFFLLMATLTATWVLSGEDGPSNGWYWPVFLLTGSGSVLIFLGACKFFGGLIDESHNGSKSE